jgi:general L-amino acid transport system permease protein
MSDAATIGAEPARVAWIRDPRIRSLIFQAVALVVVILVGWYLVDNTIDNMRKREIASGFGFLNDTAGFDIIQTLVPYTAQSTYGTAFIVGLLNTILVAAIGIFFATVIGFVIGVARLSSNWLIAKMAAAYVETFRNIPLLLQIFFWYHAVLKPLPGPRESLSFLGVVYLNNRGLYLPSPQPTLGFYVCLLLMAIGIAATVWLTKREQKRQELTGERKSVLWRGVGLTFGVPAMLFLALLLASGTPLTFGLPALTGFNFSGGIEVLPELFSLAIALSVYTAAFIAENVRSGIQAVSHGQTEAAYALGVRPNLTMRLIIIPQALRVIIPPMTSQYLNLTKNSSLAVAIAYPDLVSVFMGTTLNQTGQAVEIVAITMGVYLLLSLLTAGAMNWYNARVALVER